MKILDNIATKIADKVNAKNDEVMLLTQENDELKQKLAASNLTVSDYQKKIKKSDNELVRLNSKYTEVKKRLKDLAESGERQVDVIQEYSERIIELEEELKKNSTTSLVKELNKLNNINANQLKFIEILQVIASAKADKTQLKDVFSHNLCEYLVNNFDNVKQAADKLGVDVGRTSDLFSISWAVQMDDYFYVDSYSFIATKYGLATKEKRDGVKYTDLQTKGECSITTLDSGVIDYDEVYEWLDNFVMENELDVQCIAYDPHQYGHILTMIEKNHPEWLQVEIRQGTMTLNMPTKQFRDDVIDLKVRHSGNELLTAAINNAITKTDNNGMRIDKNKNSNKIDPIDSLKEQAENDKKYGEQLAQQAQERVNKINSILSNASKNTREISDQERQYIEANYKQLSSKQLELAGFTKNQITAIESAYQKDLTKLSYNELETRANNVSKALNSEQESYKKSRQAILDGTKDGTQRQISLLKELDTEHKNSTESMVLGLAKLRLQQGLSVDSMAAVWEQYGWTVEEVERLVAKSAESSSKNLDMFAKGMNEADIRWNELAFDPKTGEVKTNMADTLVEIAATEDGWNQLEFMAKNADLTTNAKEEIAIAMGEVDKWQFLSMDDKRLLLENDEAMLKLYDSIDELGKWDVYNADRKTLGVDNADALYSLMESKGALETWINLPVEVKQLITTDESSVTVEQAQRVLETYKALDPKTKALLGDNTDVNSKLRAAEEKLNSYERNNPKIKHLHATDNASGPASTATTAVQEFARQRDHTVTMTSRFVTINETIYQEGKASGHRAIRATGDPYFQGGPVWLGDGGKQEPYLTPQGDFGISPADWTLYDLPRGTKIWPSISKMMATLPQYSKGTQFDDTVMSRFKVGSMRGNNSNMNAVISSKLDNMISLLKDILIKEGDYAFSGIVQLENKKEVGYWIADEVKKANEKEAQMKEILKRGKAK